MSRIQGLIKIQSLINRSQQRQDWELLKKKIGTEIQEPDWNLSVAKIDKYMIKICEENNIGFKEICGCG